MICNNCGCELDDDTKPFEFVKTRKDGEIIKRKLYLCEGCKILSRMAK